MKELIEATQLIGQPDAGIFIGPLNRISYALYFGHAEFVDEQTYPNLSTTEKASYQRLDGKWVALSPGVNQRLADLEVRVSPEYECFYFERSTLFERRFH